MPVPDLLFKGTYDSLDNAWAAAASVEHGGGTGAVATTGMFFSGPTGCVITDLYYIARDLTFTDPAADVYIGFRYRYSSDGGVSFTTIPTTPIWASADCPQIWDNTNNDTEDFTLDTPIKAYAWVGAGTGGLTADHFGPTVFPANVHVIVEVAPVLASVLIDMPAADLDSFDVLVYGYYRGY